MPTLSCIFSRNSHQTAGKVMSMHRLTATLFLVSLSFLPAQFFGSTWQDEKPEGSPNQTENTTPQDPVEAAIQTAKTLRDEAEVLQDQAKFAEARKKLEQAFDIYNEATAYVGPEKSTFLIPFADIIQLQRQWDQAIQVYVRAIEFELRGTTDSKLIEKALNNMAIAIATKYKPVYALAQWSDLIDKGLLNINYAVAQSDLARAHRINSRISLLSRDLIGLADPNEALHVRNAFTYASRVKTLSYHLIDITGFRTDETDREQLEIIFGRLKQIDNELLQITAAAGVDGREFVESRIQVKLGLLEKLSEFLPTKITQITNPSRSAELLDGLNARLKPNSALIEIAKATSVNDLERTDYFAFIANKNEDDELLISMVWLEDDEDILEIAANWRDETITPSGDRHVRAQLGLDMREVFWRPISKYLGNTKNVIICSTDDLFEIEWELIPDIPTAAPPIPGYLWSLGLFAGLFLLLSIFRRSAKLLIVSLALIAISAACWFQFQNQIPSAKVLGETYQIQEFQNAYDYLRSTESFEE